MGGEKAFILECLKSCSNLIILFPIRGIRGIRYGFLSRRMDVPALQTVLPGNYYKRGAWVGGMLSKLRGGGKFTRVGQIVQVHPQRLHPLHPHQQRCSYHNPGFEGHLVEVHIQTRILSFQSANLKGWGCLQGRRRWGPGGQRRRWVIQVQAGKREHCWPGHSSCLESLYIKSIWWA